MNQKVQWPPENTTRAEFYLSQILGKRSDSVEEAGRLESKAKASLMELLRFGGWDHLQEYQDAKEYLILFDYVVPWEFRLVTPGTLRRLQQMLMSNQDQLE